MGAVAGLIAAAVIGGGTKILGSFMQKAGAKRAARAMEDALKKIKTVNIGETVNLADERDTARFAKGFEVQKEFDPTTAAAREKASANMLAGLQDDPKANALLSALQDESLKDSPLRGQIIDQLFAGAKSDLEAGATLPPEFQAELVRAGLEKTGRAGVSPDMRGAAGVVQRNLLGQAGLNLRAFNRDQASKAVTLADQLKAQRASILGNAATLTENTTTGRLARAKGVFDTTQPPAIGLKGSDVANISMQNTALQNWIEMQKGGITANLANTMAAYNAEIARTSGETGGSIITSLMGGMDFGGGAKPSATGPYSGGYQFPSGSGGYPGVTGQSMTFMQSPYYSPQQPPPNSSNNKWYLQ